MLRTKEQRDILCRSCPIARVANLLGDSCSLLILRDLLESPRRFSELEESLVGISTRTLTNKLKVLEREHLLHKTTPGKSAHVEYTLTTKGHGLRGIIKEMRAYGKKYL
ncbi:MAG: Transcriptional regulator, HxlR family [Parcubacteria group bacterium GW2011_GWA2_51_10]|nr:MAG: Transcriptional regulator, HxlR family [Parcubacteria group bacterium GW2011_GWA2_51_10]